MWDKRTVVTFNELVEVPQHVPHPHEVIERLAIPRLLIPAMWALPPIGILFFVASATLP